jgi:hypothetical protein
MSALKSVSGVRVAGQPGVSAETRRRAAGYLGRVHPSSAFNSAIKFRWRADTFARQLGLRREDAAATLNDLATLLRSNNTQDLALGHIGERLHFFRKMDFAVQGSESRLRLLTLDSGEFGTAGELTVVNPRVPEDPLPGSLVFKYFNGLDPDDYRVHPEIRAFHGARYENMISHYNTLQHGTKDAAIFYAGGETWSLAENWCLVNPSDVGSRPGRSVCEMLKFRSRELHVTDEEYDPNLVNRGRVDFGGAEVIEEPLDLARAIALMTAPHFSTLTKLAAISRFGDLSGTERMIAIEAARATGIPEVRAAAQAASLLGETSGAADRGFVPSPANGKKYSRRFLQRVFAPLFDDGNPAAQIAAIRRVPRIVADPVPRFPPAVRSRIDLAYMHVLHHGSPEAKAAAVEHLLTFLSDEMLGYRAALGTDVPQVQAAAAAQLGTLRPRRDPDALKTEAYRLAIGTGEAQVQKAAVSQLWGLPATLYQDAYGRGRELGVFSGRVTPIFS